ncbi:hypothetical protein PV783_34210 [Chitinophaga sp. CC14]|uniref:hypothetical protein n=1 Tax=Chitinophaga sp. CC14 TaxID=3029199 RepID=UPI003B786197
MPVKYTITKITWDSPPAVNQVITIQHKKATDSTWTIDSSTVQVRPDGTLVQAYDINNLDFLTAYNVQGFNNCGGAGFTEDFTTPANPCPNIIDIEGTTSIG